DLQWEFFFTCWKYNLEFYGSAHSRYKYSVGARIYYYALARKLFGRGIKYPLYRFAGLPDRLMPKRLYLDFTGYKRTKDLMKPLAKEIIPGFESVRDKGLNLIDASQLVQGPASTASSALPN